MIETATRCLRLTAGSCLLIAGVVLIPLPGPGLPVVFAALALLSRESAWARLAMRRLRESVRSIRGGRAAC